jgi:hypothetical protein
MLYTNERFGIECEEMMMEEHDSDESIMIYNSEDEYESGTESEASDEFEEDIVVENIFDREERFLDEDKVDGCYYIGLPCLMKLPREWILHISIQSRTMLSHRFDDVMRYLINYSVTRIRSPRMHIMKLDISNTGAYNVILKTHWLRLVQRTWKRIFKERQQFINNCKKPSYILHRQTHRQCVNNQHFPSVNGMLNKN